MLNFKISLPLKEALVTTFSERCALTFGKYVFGANISIPNLSQKRQFFWWHSFVFALEK